MQALINDYEKNAEVFWQMAVEKKGHIADFATRGKAKSERTELDRNCIVNTLEKDIYGNLLHIFNYKACGPVAAGFVLDYIQKTVFLTFPYGANFLSLKKKQNCILK